MRFSQPLLKTVWLALAMAPLALFAYLGQFTRFISDDYRNFFIGKELGPIGGLAHWYNNWTGAFSRSVLISLMAPADTVMVRVTLALVLAVWMLGLVWMLHQGLRYLLVKNNSIFTSIGISALVLASILNAFYSVQNLYWFTSILTYSLGLGLFTIVIAMAVWIGRGRARSFRIAVAACGVLSFLSAGTSEMQAVAQAIILTCLLPVIYVLFRFSSNARNRLLLLFVTAWLLTICALIVQAISPGVAFRSADVVRTYGMPSRDPLFLLQETSAVFLQRIQHPDAFAGFAMLMALGCLVTSRGYPPQQESNAVHSVRITAIELLFALASQLIFLPLLWSHTSDSPVFLGRFSPSYTAVILGNLALILGLALLLWRRKSVNDHLRRFDAAGLAAANVLLFALICAFVLIFTHAIDIVDLAQTYLVASSLLTLAILGRKLLVAARPLPIKRLGLLAVFLPWIACVCLAGLAFVAIYGQGYVPTRILEPVASLLVFSGLIWGAFLGCVLRASPRTSLGGDALQTLLRLACLGLLSAVGLGMFIGNAALIPDFQTYASEWDARHRNIIAMRDAGQSVIEIAPLTYSLDRFVGKSLDEGPVTEFAETYYGLDEIIVKDD